MNKSMVVGTVLGAVAATAVGSFAGYKMLNKDEFAEVVAVTPLTEQVKTPREECHDETVTKQAPVKDEHRVTGTVIGAVAGGLLGNAIGGHGSNTGAKVIGASRGRRGGSRSAAQDAGERHRHHHRTEVAIRCSTSASVRSDIASTTRSATPPGRSNSITIRVRAFLFATVSWC